VRTFGLSPPQDSGCRLDAGRPMSLLVNRWTIPDSASLNPVCQVSHLNGRCDTHQRAAASIPRMETNDDKTTRFVVIDPIFFKLEGNIYNNGFLATAQAAKRLTAPKRSAVINTRTSPDERAPAIPDTGTFRAVVRAKDLVLCPHSGGTDILVCAGTHKNVCTTRD